MHSPELLPGPSILDNAVDAADETTQATVAVPLVAPNAGVEPSVGTSLPADAPVQR